MLNCGIYKIENIVTGDFYIGQSVNLHKRKISHFGCLKRKERRNTHLQNAFDKYGKQNFVFKIILYCEPDTLTYYEQKLVDIYDPSYNICKKCVDSPKGIPQSAEAKRKNSISQKGKIRSVETRQKMSRARKGIRLSEETRLKISKANKGRIVSEETKLNMPALS